MAISTSLNSQIKFLPKAQYTTPEHISEALSIVESKATLSYQFFNTPKDAKSLKPTEENTDSNCLCW